MVGRGLETLFRVLLRPETAPPVGVSAAALVPPVVAGLLLFGLPALEILGVAVAVGALVHAGCRLLGLRLASTPILATVVGVAFVGAGAPLLWAGLVSATAAVLEVGRARLAPTARIQTGLLGYSLILLASRGAPSAYTSPGSLLGGPPPAALEPIRQWLMNPGAAQPLTMALYVGTVPGPVFATSLLAVTVGAACLWYARRLSLVSVVAFALGAAAPVLYFRWPPMLELVSGPLWFVAALMLADRRDQPPSYVIGPMLALATGAAVVASRWRGYSIEVTPVAVAIAQLMWTALEACVALLRRARGESARGQVPAPARRSSPAHRAAPPPPATLPPPVPVPLAVARRQLPRARPPVPESAPRSTQRAPVLAGYPPGPQGAPVRRTWPERNVQRGR
jgi:hypothetical protein